MTTKHRAFFLLTAIAIVGCGPKIDQGLVTHRKFVPQHVVHTTTVIHTDKQTLLMPHQYTVPDAFTVQIEANHDGKPVSRKIAVDKESYQLIRVGDWLHVDDLPLTAAAEKE